MAVTSRRGRPTHAEAEKLSQRLREAAVEMFLEHGYDGTTMEAVARAAGISKRTLYLRYPDKHTLFAAVIPWALSRFEFDQDHEGDCEEVDLTETLTKIGRAAIAHAVDPERAQLLRIAINAAAQFPEFGMAAQTLAWSPQQRAVVATLQRHHESDGLVIGNIETAAEQFIAMVALVASRMADFGVYRTPEVEEDHLAHAVALFVRGILPTNRRADE